jgi:hypothetical protein
MIKIRYAKIVPEIATIRQMHSESRELYRTVRLNTFYQFNLNGSNCFYEINMKMKYYDCYEKYQ